MRPLEICLGADPDTRTPAIAALDFHTEKPVGVLLVKAPKDGKDGAAAVTCALALRRCLVPFMAAMGNPRIVCAAVEGQSAEQARANRAKGQKVRMQDIITLANSGGALLSEVCNLFSRGFDIEHDQIEMPTPHTWKGQVEKHAHQARTYRHIGWEYEKIGSGRSAYSRPTSPEQYEHVLNAPHIPKGAWKHMGDAIGIALWKARTYKTQLAIRAVRKLQ